MDKVEPKNEAKKIADLIAGADPKKGFKGSRVVNYDDDELMEGEIEILFRGGKYMPLPASKDPAKAGDRWAKIEYMGGSMMCRAVLGLDTVPKTELIRANASMARDGIRIDEILEVIDAKGRHRLTPPSGLPR